MGPRLKSQHHVSFNKQDSEMTTQNPEDLITDDDLCEACARLYWFATDSNKATVLAMLRHFLQSHPELQVTERTTP